MFILFIIVFFLVLERQGLKVFINNEYKESFSDGSEKSPFKSLHEACTSYSTKDYHNETIFFIILSNKAEYEINSSISFNQSIIISYKSYQNEKAKVVFLLNSSFSTLSNLFI